MVLDKQLNCRSGKSGSKNSIDQKVRGSDTTRRASISTFPIKHLLQLCTLNMPSALQQAPFRNYLSELAWPLGAPKQAWVADLIKCICLRLHTGCTYAGLLMLS